MKNARTKFLQVPDQLASYPWPVPPKSPPYFLEIEVGGVKETVRCDIANVAVDLIIARDFMRRHRAVIEVGGENEPDKLHAIQQHFHRSVHKDATAPRFPDHPKEREKTTPIPIFRHKNPDSAAF